MTASPSLLTLLDADDRPAVLPRDDRSYAPYEPVSETSRQAAASIDVDRLERIVFDCLRRHGPLTTDEIEVLTDLPHQTASPRVIGLTNKGIVEKTDAVRKTRSGRNATVVRIVPGVTLPEKESR